MLREKIDSRGEAVVNKDKKSPHPPLAMNNRRHHGPAHTPTHHRQFSVAATQLPSTHTAAPSPVSCNCGRRDVSPTPARTPNDSDATPATSTATSPSCCHRFLDGLLPDVTRCRGPLRLRQATAAIGRAAAGRVRALSGSEPPHALPDLRGIRRTPAGQDGALGGAASSSSARRG
jgi:hypothetical protein